MQQHFISRDLQGLRNEYKELCFKFHPDVSGFDSTEIMKEINAEYDLKSKSLAAETQFNDSEIESSELFRQKIEALINVKNISIEIIGNWLWVQGDTKPIKELLKEMGFQFAPKKVAWFFKNYTYRKKGKETEDFDSMRNMFGSQKVDTKEKENIPLR